MCYFFKLRPMLLVPCFDSIENLDVARRGASLKLRLGEAAIELSLGLSLLLLQELNLNRQTCKHLTINLRSCLPSRASQDSFTTSRSRSRTCLSDSTLF